MIAALFVLWFLCALFQPFHGDGSGKVAVTIPKGASVSEVGDLLDEKGVIANSTLFQIRVTLAGKRSELYSGHFTLANDMSYGAAIDALSTPPVKRTITVTIPEGYSRAQTAQLVEEAALRGRLHKATVELEVPRPGRIRRQGRQEPRGLPLPRHLRTEAERAGRRPGPAAAAGLQAADQGRRHELREVEEPDRLRRADDRLDDRATRPACDSQRKLVAAVIYNRLHEGMPLGIDATIRFATGNYTEPLTESELAIDSPYNTRTNAGLPPGPIGSPGLAAIEAAAHPAEDRLPLLRGQAGHLRRARLLQDRSRIRSRRRHATTRPAKRPAATRRTPAGNSDAAARGARPPGRPLALAGDAERGAGGAGAGGRVELRGDRRRPGRLRGAGAGDAGAKASSAPT